MDEQLAGIKVKFKSYYKYTFTFSNDLGYEVYCGGIHDEIYRCSIEADREYTIREATDKCGGSLSIYFNGERIYEEPW